MGKKLGYFLARIDDTAIAFVAKLPGGSMFPAGAFGADGTFYIASNAAGKAKLYSFAGLAGLTGYASIDDPLKDFSAAVPFTDANLPAMADLVLVQADIEKIGVQQDFLLSFTNRLVVILISSKPYKVWNLPVSGLEGVSKQLGWGAGWNFKNKVYFSSNAGAGVYQIDLTSINLGSKTANIVKAGTSEATTSNDGLNCPSVDSPFTITTTTTTSTGKRKCVKGFVSDSDCECDGRMVCERCSVEEHCGGKGTVTSNSTGTKCVCRP
eukprot:gnl/TRDRNA2_/TRDRNA2_176924_c6_seq8.p1 gnl/TRDRNA2_/TRDRNA2_176924_c6~~gnl/TRDRNA2_/TRDRNA2_176924_c6_seq8.p1  ORF type:complete len:295 (+),score=56.43 gnl/TRDRNA2_/TRDRNA2_176924_c6_seq8:87-887(+)